MSDHKKHIVLLTPGFPENEQDSTCIPALQVYCRALLEIGHLITVITVHYPSQKRTYQWNGITVYALGINNKMSHRLGGFYRHWKTLSTVHHKTPIDVLHSFWLGECAFIGHHFSERKKLKHLTTLMGQDAKEGNRYAKLLPLPKMNIVSLSEFQRQIFQKNYGKETPIIPWGISIEEMCDVSKKTIDILGVGSLISLKRYSDFIEACALIQKSRPNLKAVLVGEGELKSELQNQISDLKLENHIELIGNCSYEETMHLMAQAKVLLHPSEYESYGMIFAEAQAHRMFIVSQKVGITLESPFWAVGTKPEEFAAYCSDFLNHNALPTIKHLSISESVNAYQKIYIES